MKRYWDQLSIKIDAMARRERLMVLVAVVICVIAVLNALLLDPLTARKKLLQTRMATESQQLTAMRAQIQATIAAGKIDPDAGNKARLATLQVQQQEIDVALESLQQGLVSPEKMPRLLESVLRKDMRLKLVAMKTLPVTGMTGLPIEPAETANQSAPNKAADIEPLPIFRHGVEVTVQGGYLDLISYLAELETLPWRLVWGGLSLEANEFPMSTMTVTIYTLSLDKAWLSI